MFIQAMQILKFNQTPGTMRRNTAFSNNSGIRPLLHDSVCFSGKSVVKPLPPVLQRDKVNPLLTPASVNEALGSNYFATFNPGVISDGKGGAHLLIRAVRGKNYPELPFYSDLIYARSKDGNAIEEGSMKTIIEPNEQFPNGFEDPRITKFKDDDNYYIVCTGYDGEFPRICLWTTTDLADKEKFKFEGPIGPEEKLLSKDVHDKDAFFHGEKVDGQFMLYHRIDKNIQAVKADTIEQFKDPDFWEAQINDLQKNTIMESKPNTWEYKLGGGPPPLKTKDGWLMLYHSSDKAGDGRQYCGGLALLDLNDPMQVIARAPVPIIKPETDYEKNGPVPGVVFPQGLVQQQDNLLVYYGCGDKNVGVAKTKISELLNYVNQFDEAGNIKAQKYEQLEIEEDYCYRDNFSRQIPANPV